MMGILNVTPDSFFDGGRYRNLDDALRLAETHIEAGATFIDMGGMSTRPKSELISVDKELARLLPAIEAIRAQFPEVVISADTFRARVAKEAVMSGCGYESMTWEVARLMNTCFKTVAELNVPLCDDAYSKVRLKPCRKTQYIGMCCLRWKTILFNDVSHFVPSA